LRARNSTAQPALFTGERYLLSVGRQIVEYLVNAYANHYRQRCRRTTDYM